MPIEIDQFFKKYGLMPKQIFLFCFLIIVVLLGLTGCGSTKMVVKSSDKQVLITAKDFLEFDCQAGHDDNFGSFEKSKWLDSQYLLNYEFDSHDSEVPCPIVIREELSVHENTSGASACYSGLEIGFNLGLFFTDFERERLDESFEIGDNSRFELLYADDIPIGNLFAARFDNVVYYILFLGVFFDDSESWKALISPKIDEINAYRP